MDILRVNNLKIHFPTDFGLVKAVDGVSFDVKRSEVLGIVGESGCGKSITAKSLIGLIWPPGKIVGGEILFHQNGATIPIHKLGYKSKKIRSIRGKLISMIFQEPMTALNPVYTIENQIVETITLHQKINKKQAKKTAIRMLTKVGIPAASKRLNNFPHQLSGGIRQRVMIAMALACQPSILIADEPTTALDVTIQAQVLELMSDLQKEMKTSIILITHDLGVIAQMADNVIVMYLGRVVERADVQTLFINPKHPYTQGLMASIPNVLDSQKDLKPIKGMVPSSTESIPGCHFQERCPNSNRICIEKNPPLKQVGENHDVACWLA